MAFIAPIPQDHLAIQPPAMAVPPTQGFGADSMVRRGLGAQRSFFELLQSIFNAPGSEALIGGPMAVRSFYHGTTEPAARNILQGGFDINKFGSGVDSAKSVFKNPTGWFGKGHYVTEKPENASWYAEQHSNLTGEMPSVVKTNIDDTHLLDLSSPKARASAVQAYAKEHGLNSKGISSESLAALTDRELAPYMNEYAQRSGKKGVMWPAETVVFDPAVMQGTQRHK